jgi:hypothetical protein
VKQSVLHNPRSDRRTTAGIFHVTEGGLPILADKRAAPIAAFAHLLAKALNPPFVANCEYRLFQRPDDAIHRGYDKMTDYDFSQDGNFFSNYAPLKPARAVQMVEKAIRFGQFTEPMQTMVRDVADGRKGTCFVCSDSPPDRLQRACRRRDAAEAEDYLKKLRGTLGVHPLKR